jgi:hypothetical protein
MNNQLIKTETQIVVSPNRVVMALQGKKISDCTDVELGSKISACVEKAWGDLGLRAISDTDYDLLKLNLLNECRMSFYNLTLDELQAAIHNGVRGKYGEVFGLSVIGVTKWLASYMTAMERQEGKKQLEKLKEEAKPEPTADEKFTTGKELSVTLFEKFKKSGQFDRTLLAVYEFCKYYDLIDKDYRKGIYKEAVELLVKLSEIESGLSTDLFKRRRLNAELELLKENIQKDILTVDQHNDVLRSAKLIALKNWFNDLIIEETNFDELIETKRTIHAR